MTLPIEAIRKDFPILQEKINGQSLIYFDNAASSQVPEPVLEAILAYYHHHHANIHRGVHTLSQRATQTYEEIRQKLADFIGAGSASEIIFTRGTTEGLNFLARSLVSPQLQAGDQVLTTYLEHHSNLVPWQEVCLEKQAQLSYLDLDENQQVDLKALDQLDASKVKALVIQHVSNVLGHAQDLEALSRWAEAKGILLIVDGAQAVPHQPVDLQATPVAGYCFSSHKMYGPTGVGVCVLNQKYHDLCQPHFYGGEMIHYVGDYQANFKEAPWKFEAGTMPLAQVVGLGAAISYIQSIGYDRIQTHLQLLTDQLLEGLNQIEGLTLYRPPVAVKQGIVSFNLEGIHPHDAASAYDLEGIAVRAGHHCTQPLMRRLGIPACLRASLAVYNSQEEVERFIEVTKQVKEFFAYGT